MNLGDLKKINRNVPAEVPTPQPVKEPEPVPAGATSTVKLGAYLRLTRRTNGQEK